MQRFCNLLERIIKHNPRLAEAKADALMKALADKYEDQVAHSSTLRNNVDRAEIEYAIEFFKKFKDSIDIPELKQIRDRLAKDPNSEELKKKKAELEKELAKERDITNWTIRELLQFLKSKPGYNPPTEGEEEEEEAPPIPYQKDGLTIYDGSNEDRCVRIGKGERWCITQGSFANYRYDANKKYPTFYLVKDDRVDSNGKRIVPEKSAKSFFVVMVGNDGTYKASDRTNNDIGGRGSEWDTWQKWSEVEKHFPSVTGLEHVFKYRKISPSEMDTKGMHTVEDWIHAKNVNKKNQRLIDALRGGGSRPFRNAAGNYVDWGTFIRKYLTQPEMKPVADLFVKSTYENPEVFLQNYEYFTPAQQKSIIANTNNPQHPIGVTADDLVSQYKRDAVAYKTVVDLVKADKIKPTSTTHLYLTGRDNVVCLDIGSEIKVYVLDKGGIDQIKLTPKTEYYLADDPNLASINLQTLANTINTNGLSNNILQKATAGESENKELVKVDDTSYIIQYDEDSVSVVNTSGASIKKGLPKQVVDKLADSIKSNTAKRKSFAKSILKNNAPNMPPADYTSIIDGLSPEERTIQDGDEALYLNAQPSGIIVFKSNMDPNNPTLNTELRGYGTSYPGPHRYNSDPPQNQITAATVDAFQNFLPPLTAQGLIRFFNNSGYRLARLKNDLNNIRLTPDNDLVMIPKEDSIWLVNKANKDLSKKYNFSSGNIVNLRLSQANYDQVLGRQAQPRQQPAATRATAAGATTPAQPTAGAQGGNTDLLALLADRGITTQGIPDQVLNRLRQGGQPRAVGADTINRFLNIGTVRGYQLQGRASSMFIITLTDTNRGIATVHMQPGNIHGVLSSRGWTRATNSGDVPTRVAQALQESLNNNKMTNKLSLIRKIAEQVLRENQPAWAPKPGERDREVADPDTDTEEQPLIAPGHPGHDDDNIPDERPKAKTTQENKEARATIIKKLKAGM